MFTGEGPFTTQRPIIPNAEAMLIVVLKPRAMPIIMWLDNIYSHLKGTNTCLKEFLETHCFENIKSLADIDVWSSGEDH